MGDLGWSTVFIHLVAHLIEGQNHFIRQINSVWKYLTIKAKEKKEALFSSDDVIYIRNQPYEAHAVYMKERRLIQVNNTYLSDMATL